MDHQETDQQEDRTAPKRGAEDEGWPDEELRTDLRDGLRRQGLPLGAVPLR